MIFFFIVDENDYLIYAPDSADIGKKASNVVYGNYNLGDLWEKVNADNKKENNGEQSLIKKVALFNKKWYLIQNSDVMFRGGAGKDPEYLASGICNLSVMCSDCRSAYPTA